MKLAVKSKPRKLTNKQRKFIAEYLNNGFNGTQAAVVAYPNQSVATAGQQAYENMKKPEVQQAIDNALAKHELTPELAVKNIGTVANAELTDKNSGHILKANEMILELHGYKKNSSPELSLNINQFFNRNKSKFIPSQQG